MGGETRPYYFLEVFMKDEMIKKETWESFRESGLFWFINIILQIFGWSIVIEFNNKGKIKEAYPVRSKFRGFSEKISEQGIYRITKFLHEHIDELMDDVKDLGDQK